MSSMKMEGSFRSYESVRESKLEELAPGAKRMPTNRGGSANDSNYKANVLDIDKLGKSMAEALNNNDMETYGNLKTEMEQAKIQYISAVSPDRVALMEETTTFLDRFGEGFRKNKKPPADGLTLLDFLNIKDGLGSVKDPLKEELKAKLGSGATVTFLGSDFDPNNFDVKGKGDDTAVLIHRKNKWEYKLTRQEQIREQDFLKRVELAKGTSTEGAAITKLDVKV